jgi:hypothetical protein
MLSARVRGGITRFVKRSAERLQQAHGRSQRSARLYLHHGDAREHAAIGTGMAEQHRHELELRVLRGRPRDLRRVRGGLGVGRVVQLSLFEQVVCDPGIDVHALAQTTELRDAHGVLTLDDVQATGARSTLAQQALERLLRALLRTARLVEDRRHLRLELAARQR